MACTGVSSSTNAGDSKTASLISPGEGCSKGSRPPVAYASPAARDGARMNRKKKLKHLEKKLEMYSRQIKKFSEVEVTLDEMDSGFSAYLKEDALKRKFVQSWDKLCELKQVQPFIAIEDEATAGYSGTPYPEINRRVQRLLRMDEFPDHFDCVELVDRCNSKHELGISSEERRHISRRVFKEVGKILKKRRQNDFKIHLGCHLTDSVRPEEEDPALRDSCLLKQLAKQERLGAEKMEQVCEEFVMRQERDGDKTDEGESEESSEAASAQQQASPATPDDTGENDMESSGGGEGEGEEEEGKEAPDSTVTVPPTSWEGEDKQPVTSSSMVESSLEMFSDIPSPVVSLHNDSDDSDIQIVSVTDPSS